MNKAGFIAVAVLVPLSGLACLILLACLLAWSIGWCCGNRATAEENQDDDKTEQIPLQDIPGQEEEEAEEAAAEPRMQG